MKHVLIAVLAIALLSSVTYSGNLTPEQEKRLETLEQFKIKTETGPVGRFQGISNGKELWIIDTQMGHFWLYGASSDGVGLVYCGQVITGKKPSDIIFFRKNESPLK